MTESHKEFSSRKLHRPDYFNITWRWDSHSESGPAAAERCLVIINCFYSSSRTTCESTSRHTSEAQEEPFPGHKRSWYFKTYLGLSKELLAKSILGKGYVSRFCEYRSSVSWLKRLRVSSWFLILPEKYFISATFSEYQLYLISASSLVLSFIFVLFTIYSFLQIG